MNLECRGCSAPLKTIFADLGRSPLSNALVSFEDVWKPQETYPLRIFVCDKCKLVQSPLTVQPFTNDYPYFSSTSASWVAHHKAFAETVVKRFGPDFVVDVGSNDGYLLQHFEGCRVLGVEPSRNVAEAAERKGITTEVKFFTPNYARDVQRRKGQADFINATNVLAHTPRLHDFIEAFNILLAPEGVATFEFPHVGNLIEQTQLDTIYHEHFSYFSMYSLWPVLAYHGLRIFDVDRLETHGGSVRLYVCHKNSSHVTQIGKTRLDIWERDLGYKDLKTYQNFASQCVRVKCEFLNFLIDCASHRERVVGYGAPAKATTLFNYCGIGPELLAYTVDDAPSKQDKLIPGCNIPIFHPDMLADPDHVLILAWNLIDELAPKVRERCPKARIWTAIPQLTQHRP